MAILRVTMQKQYSIAEARDKLASTVHEVEKAGPIKLTRRGKPVAVLIAESEYERLRGGKASFWTAIERFRTTHDLGELGVTDADFEGLRDKRPGREVPW